MFLLHMCAVRASLLFALMSCLAHGQVVVPTSSVTSSLPDPVATGSSAQYWFPLNGLDPYHSDGADGLQATTPDSPMAIMTYGIYVSNVSSVAPVNLGNTDNTQTVYNASGQNGLLQFPTADNAQHDKAVSIGPNSYFDYAIGGTLVPTLPFGITLGYTYYFQGSLIIGGQYDANKVASPSWTLVQESAHDGTILENGTQAMMATLIGNNQPNSTGLVTLDINAEAMSLPMGFNCSAPLTITIPGSNTPLTIDMPTEYVNRTGCTVLSNSSAPVLGKPFFQAAYAYVDATSAIYLAEANAYPLSPLPQTFNASAKLTPAKPPPGFSAASTHVPSIGILVSLVCALAMALSGVC